MLADDYAALHEWSISHIPEFWSAVWDYCGVVSSQRWDEGHVLELGKSMDEIPAWFRGARLNWAENMLSRQTADSKVALIEAGPSACARFEAPESNAARLTAVAPQSSPSRGASSPTHASPGARSA